MNKTSQKMIYNIFINSPKFKIQNVEPIESKIPGSIKILLHSPTMKLVIVIDERFNTIHIPIKILSKEESKAIEYIRLKFNELKISDPSYGNIDSGKIAYEPSKYIFIKDFFDFLRIENRESIIESIIES